MEVFRLVRERHAKVLSGIGASLKGARWNSVGFEMVYVASNRSLAMAEIAVHFSLATLPPDYMMLTIDIPDNVPILTYEESILPENWNGFPYFSYTQKTGDAFVMALNFCVMKVPSVVTKGDYNYLLSPHHPDFKKIKIIQSEPFPFDRRIFEKLD